MGREYHSNLPAGFHRLKDPPTPTPRGVNRSSNDTLCNGSTSLTMGDDAIDLGANPIVTIFALGIIERDDGKDECQCDAVLVFWGEGGGGGWVGRWWDWVTEARRRLWGDRPGRRNGRRMARKRLVGTE